MNIRIISRLFLVLALTTSVDFSSLSAFFVPEQKACLITTLNSLTESVRNEDESQYKAAIEIIRQQINNPDLQIQSNLLKLSIELVRKGHELAYKPAHILATTIAPKLPTGPRNEQALENLHLLVELFELLVEKGHKAAYIDAQTFTQNVVKFINEL